MAAFRIHLRTGNAGFICRSGFFLLLVVNCQFAVTYITWTEPPPAWNQTSQSDFRTVDILVFNRSTQVHLKWNYILSAGSNLQSTTFSIIDERSINGIGAIYHGSDTTAIFDGYRTRFNISRSEVATLIINRATEREEATYQCLLTTTTNQWRYNVRVKLTELQIHWDKIPSNLSTVHEGNNITLQWRYSYTLGLPPSFRDATFTDLRDGEEKRIANKPRQDDLYVDPAYRDRFRIHIQDTEASMTVLTAHRSDSGRYKFKVETLNNNKLGWLTNIIEISVQFAANLTNVSRDQTVREDSNMQLLCEATGEPKPNITWIRVLEDGSSSERLHLGQTWDFPNISRTASGTYRCTADNGFGNPVSHKVKVNVRYPAKIIKLASEHEVAAQQNVSLHCQAEGNPLPTYSWIPCDPQQSVCNNSALNITEVLSDIVYTCNVTNVLGSDARNTSLVVASTVINVTLVITSESCTDGQFSQTGLLWNKLQDTIDGIFTREISYQSSILLNVRCGSVIVDLALQFNSTVKESDVLRRLQDAAKDGKLGDLDVNASSIVGSRPPLPSPTASTRPSSSPEIGASPTASPDQSDEDKALKDWMIAVIAGVTGALIIVILVLLIYCFTIRKKSDRADDVDMSPTSRYAVGGPSVSRSMDKRSYGTESVEDDPFILAASTQSLNSIGNGNKKKNPNVNYGYSSEDAVQPQPEMLLKPGSRVSNTRPTAQSSGELVANSSYLVRGPQRDLNTLPMRQEPPSFEEAMLRSETSGYPTEPGKGKYAGRRPKHPQSTSGPSKGPLDPTVIYAMPHKKGKISSNPPEELHGPTSGNPPEYNQTERSGDSMLLQQVDLALDDPSHLPPTENPPRNKAVFNKDDQLYDLPELPANFKSAVGRNSRSDSDGAILNPPASTGRKKQPYFNVHGQLVRPALQDSGDVRRPEFSRATQNTLSPDPGIPLNQVQPRGSESEYRDEEDNDNITYVV